MLKKDLYARIHSLCPHRSVDSIKKMLQHHKWEPPNPSVMRELPLVLVGEHTCGIAGSDGRQIEQKDKVQGKGPRTWTEREDEFLLWNANREWTPGMTKRALADTLSLILEG